MDNILIYLTIGSLMGVVLYFTMSKVFLGKIYGAITIGIIGAILGGSFLNLPVKPVIEFLQNKGIHIDFFPTILGSIILVWIYKVISSGIKNK